jgi:Uma2 family endonuclease
VVVVTTTHFEDTPLAPPTTLGPYRRRDYESLPDEPRCELIYGRLYVTPSPYVLHQVVVTEIWCVLNSAATRTGGLALVAPMDVHLAEHSVVQPDVVYLSAARRELVQQWIEGAPDLVVEVLSRGTARKDRGEKLRLYAATGVREYWIVDAEERQIEHLVNRDGEMTVVLAADASYRSPVVEEIELDLDALWTAVESRLGH